MENHHECIHYRRGHASALAPIEVLAPATREQAEKMEGQGVRTMEQQREMEQERMEGNGEGSMERERQMEHDRMNEGEGTMERQREMEQKESGEANQGEEKKERKWWRFWEEGVKLLPPGPFAGPPGTGPGCGNRADLSPRSPGWIPPGFRRCSTGRL